MCEVGCSMFDIQKLDPTFSLKEYLCSMIAIDNTLISDDVRQVRFCCNLEKCLGACCIEGDAGAPLEEEEITLLEDYIEEIKPFMLPAGIEVIEKNGVFDYDMFGHFVTPLVNDQECAFVYFEKGIARCAIEKAYQQSKIGFAKPVSCHLYPVRISTYKEFQAVNYHEWHICREALIKGKMDNVPLYRFLGDALTRKFGQDWYEKLVDTIESNRK